MAAGSAGGTVMVMMSKDSMMMVLAGTWGGQEERSVVVLPCRISRSQGKCHMADSSDPTVNTSHRKSPVHVKLNQNLGVKESGDTTEQPSGLKTADLFVHVYFTVSLTTGGPKYFIYAHLIDDNVTSFHLYCTFLSLVADTRVCSRCLTL